MEKAETEREGNKERQRDGEGGNTRGREGAREPESERSLIDRGAGAVKMTDTLLLTREALWHPEKGDLLGRTY